MEPHARHIRYANHASRNAFDVTKPWHSIPGRQDIGKGGAAAPVLPSWISPSRRPATSDSGRWTLSLHGRWTFRCSDALRSSFSILTGCGFTVDIAGRGDRQARLEALAGVD